MKEWKSCEVIPPEIVLDDSDKKRETLTPEDVLRVKPQLRELSHHISHDKHGNDNKKEITQTEHTLSERHEMITIVGSDKEELNVMEFVNIKDLKNNDKKINDNLNELLFVFNVKLTHANMLENDNMFRMSGGNTNRKQTTQHNINITTHSMSNLGTRNEFNQRLEIKIIGKDNKDSTIVLSHHQLLLSDVMFELLMNVPNSRKAKETKVEIKSSIGWQLRRISYLIFYFLFFIFYFIFF